MCMRGCDCWQLVLWLTWRSKSCRPVLASLRPLSVSSNQIPRRRSRGITTAHLMILTSLDGQTSTAVSAFTNLTHDIVVDVLSVLFCCVMYITNSPCSLWLLVLRSSYSRQDPAGGAENAGVELWKTRGDPASEEEMEHAERQTHQGVHDKIWQRCIQSYSVPDGREPLNGCSHWSRYCGYIM